MNSPSEVDTIVEAALRLAAARPWREVTLADIARESGMSLAELSQHVGGKADILRAFIRSTDRRLLASLSNEAIEGDGHDRLFDIMLRRFELLAPYKKAIASMARSSDGGPSEWLHVLAAALDSQGWALAAAGLEAPGLKGDLHRLGLARVHAALDRGLRDGEAFMRRLETPIALCTSFVRAFREFRAARANEKSQSKPADDSDHESSP